MLFRMGRESARSFSGTTPPHAVHQRTGKGVALQRLGEICVPLGDSCGRPELSRRDADQALEVEGELALVREPDPRRDLRQGEVLGSLQEVPGPLDAPCDDVLVRR